jgi:hypothetical protein
VGTVARSEKNEKGGDMPILKKCAITVIVLQAGA